GSQLKLTEKLLDILSGRNLAKHVRAEFTEEDAFKIHEFWASCCGDLLAEALSRLDRYALDLRERNRQAMVQQAFARAGVSQSLETPRLERPLVAILPFVDLAGDPLQEYFGEGITQDIITELSRFSELSVIAWNVTLPYRAKLVDPRQLRREL